MPNFETTSLNEYKTDLHATKPNQYIKSTSLWEYAYHGMKRSIGGEQGVQSWPKNM